MRLVSGAEPRDLFAKKVTVEMTLAEVAMIGAVFNGDNVVKKHLFEVVRERFGHDAWQVAIDTNARASLYNGALDILAGHGVQEAE